MIIRFNYKQIAHLKPEKGAHYHRNLQTCIWTRYMKNTGFEIGLFTLLLIAIISFSNCEREYFDDQYHDIYGTWVIRAILGGFSGGGYKPDFDCLEINKNGIFSIYRNDTIVSCGEIRIINQSNNNLTIKFLTNSGKCFFSDFEKNVTLKQDTLYLSDNCFDCLSYYFIRCEKYFDNNYIQLSETLEYINITKHNIGIDKHFTSLFFLNENLGFITCYDGYILKTDDGGENWSIKPTNNDLPLYGISFINENTGFAVGGKSYCDGTGCIVPGSIMLRTDDGGESWIKQDILNDWSELNLIQFINDHIGFAMGTGIRLKTVDGGNTWVDFETNYMGYVYDLYFLNERVGFMPGLKGNLFKTTDCGETWQDLSINVNYQLYSVMFVNEQIGYLGQYKNLMKTTDGGHTWINMDYAPAGVVKMDFTSESSGVVFGSREYSSSKCDVWDSEIHFFVNGKWYGDVRVAFRFPPYAVNSDLFFAITNSNEIAKIEISN